MQLCGLKKGTELLYDVIELGVLWFCELRGYLDVNGKEKEMSNALAYKYLREILSIGVPYPHVNTVETGEDYDEDVYEDLEFDELRLEMDLHKIFQKLENGEELPSYINLCAITDQCLADLIEERLVRVTRELEATILMTLQLRVTAAGRKLYTRGVQREITFLRYVER